MLKLKSVAVGILLLILISSYPANGSVIKKSKNSRKAPPLPTNIQFSRHSGPPLQEPQCNLDEALIKEIQDYQPIVNRIIETAVNGDFKGRTYDDTALFVDQYNHRLFGSQMLEDSIDYMMDKMTADGLQNVRGEVVPVPQWIRGEESAELLEPRHKKLKILGLGTSVGTDELGITAEVLVVHSFDELEEKKEMASGKIIVYNQGWLGSYGSTSSYRSNGAIRAAKVGGIAALVESLAPFSLDTPHTGAMNYEDGVTKIPSASITKEDAEFLSRIQDRGQTIKIHLKMLDTPMEMTTSRNVIGEIVGRELPEEIVAVSGHSDSWDVGQGAMDDAGGVFISTEALALIKHLDLPRPRRTLQTILWTAEEAGLWGVLGYLEAHRDELENMKAVFESDGGTFKPKGLEFAGTDEASCIIQEILNLLISINTTTIIRYDSVGSDISYLVDENVPGLSLSHESNAYFWYHHSEADTMTVLDSDEMDLCTALWAAVSYVLADLSVVLPRRGAPTPAP